jgi:FdhD protein
MSGPRHRAGQVASSAAFAERSVLTVQGGRWQFAADVVVRETHLGMLVDGERLATLACSPHDLTDLVHGFLFSQAVIGAASDVCELAFAGAVDEAEAARNSSATAPEIMVEVSFRNRSTAQLARERLSGVRFVPSGCGQAPPQNSPEARASSAATIWQPALIPALARLIQGASPVFAATGGVHASALVDLSDPAADPAQPRLLVVREDIGRHNTVDKVIGWCLCNRVNPADTGLVVTGRLSADLVAKAETAGIRLVVSRSAPTDVAVEMAEAAGVTLVGFARQERFNVYSNWWRLRLTEGD